MERVLRNGIPQRRLRLVTTTGRKVPYLLQSLGGVTGGLYESWREVRVTQLFRTINTLLLKVSHLSFTFCHNYMFAVVLACTRMISIETKSNGNSMKDLN